MEDRFSTYSPTQLAGEDTFIRWVLHGDHHEAWSLWLAAHPSMLGSIGEAKKMVTALASQPTPSLSSLEKADIWTNIESKIQSAPATRPKPQLRHLWRWTIAAAAALALLVWFNNSIAHEKLITDAGERKELMLPESSVVTLNAASKVSFNKKAFPSSRMIMLEGEAFFEVEPGSTFTVVTDEGQVTVLGTSFNVYARDGHFEVTCYTGKVKVIDGKKEEAIITPGEKVLTTTAGLLERTSVDATPEGPEWLQGKFTFDNQPLEVVLAELKRQYDVRIQVDQGLDTLRYTGLFEKGDLQKSLELITWPLHLQFTIKGNTVTISR